MAASFLASVFKHFSCMLVLGREFFFEISPKMSAPIAIPESADPKGHAPRSGKLRVIPMGSTTSCLSPNPEKFSQGYVSQPMPGIPCPPPGLFR